MDHDAAPGTQVPDDGVAGQRAAAFGVADHQAFAAADGQRPAIVFVLALVVIAGAGQFARHQRRQAVAHADVFQQIVQLQIAVTGQLADYPLNGQVVQAHVVRVQGLGQQPLAQLHRVFAALVFEKVANVGARLAGDHEVQPGRVRGGVGGGDDFYRLPGF